MDKNFTARIAMWLNTAPKSRDLAQGALMLLQLSSNRIEYNNVMADLQRKADYLATRLRYYYKFRVQALSHEDVAEVVSKAEMIAEQTASKIEKAQTEAPKTKGKRPDHDSLPDDIKAAWVENLDLARRISECHRQLRAMSASKARCTDSDRYPLAQEIIRCDKLLHKNYNAYDSYVAVNNTPET